MSQRTLENRVILISGASGALGSVAAKACAAQGATVVLLGRTIAKLEKVYDAIIAAGGPEPAIYPFDLAGAAENHYQELALVLERELGGLHGLMHCAADFAPLGPLTDISGATWQRMLHINLTAPFVLTRELLPLLIQAGNASVIFTSDSAARAGKAYWGAYGVAKIALEGLAGILADEQEGRLKVQVFTPGPMRSPIRRLAYPGENPDSLPSPDVHAERIVSLLSPYT